MATNSTSQGQDTSKDTYTTLQGTYQGKPQIAYPDTPAFTPAQPVPVGGVILADGDIEYNVGRRTVSLKVRNTGDRPVQVGAHFHFFEVNRYARPHSGIISTFPPRRLYVSSRARRRRSSL